MKIQLQKREKIYLNFKKINKKGTGMLDSSRNKEAVGYCLILLISRNSFVWTKPNLDFD